MQRTWSTDMRGVRGLRGPRAVFSRDSGTADSEGRWQGNLTTVVSLRGTWKPEEAAKVDSAGRPTDKKPARFECRNRVAILPGDICAVVGQSFIVETVAPGLKGVTLITLKRPLPGPF